MKNLLPLFRHQTHCTSSSLLSEGADTWQLHKCRNVRLFHDTNVFCLFDSQGRPFNPDHLWQTLPGQGDPVDRIRDHISGSRFRKPRRIRHSIVSLFASHSGRNYYHWMFDVLPLVYLLRQAFSGNPQGLHLFQGSGDLPYQKTTLEILGIPKECYSGNSRHHHIDCDQLIYTSPVRNGRHWYEGSHPDWSISFLRDSFLGAASESSGPTRFYIQRKDSAKGRHVINEAEVITMLARHGIEPVCLSGLGFREQVALFRDAHMVIGLHGAGLTNLVFSKPGCRVIEIMAPEYVRHFKELSKRLGLAYEMSISCNYSRAGLDASGKRDQHRDVVIDTAALEKAILSQAT